MGSASKLHLNPPFRAEHIGSFIRPKELFEKRQLFEEKKCTKEDLRALEDEAIKHIVKLQQEVGIKSITDGEMRREIFHEGVFNNLSGVRDVPDRPLDEFQQYVPFIIAMKEAGIKTLATFFCDGKIKRTRGFYVDDFKYLKSLVAPEDVKHIKITMCSPTWVHQRHGSDLTYDLSVYKNDDEYFEDLAAAYREEFQELYDLGCRHIQIDNPSFCYFCSDIMLAGMKNAGVDHVSLLDTYIRGINACTRDRRNDMTMGMHLCRGNFKGEHFSEGGYARIATKLFNDLDIDVFYLEYDTERAGDFSPLHHLPPDKTAVLGLITSKRPELENLELLKTRVNEAVDAMCKGRPGRTRESALNQLCVSPQCGFASVWQGNPVTEKDERKKLSLVVELASHFWKD